MRPMQKCTGVFHFNRSFSTSFPDFTVLDECIMMDKSKGCCDILNLRMSDIKSMPDLQGYKTGVMR